MKICLIGPTHPFSSGISHYAILIYRSLRNRNDLLKGI